MDTNNLLWLEAQNKATDPAQFSVQSRREPTAGFAPVSDVAGMAGILWVTLAKQLEDEPRWNALYPNWRDRFLREFSRSESMAASAVYSMKTRIGTLNYNLQAPPRAKKFSQDLLNNPGLGDTLSQVTEKLSDDLDTSDNGAFMELWRTGNPAKPPPKGSPVLGFAHLDSRQCWRSFDPEFPVWYTNPVTGAIRKLHKDRVVFAADNPQPIELARGIGFCSISRASRMIRVFRNMQIFVDEKVSGRFTRALGAISGVSAKQVQNALQDHKDGQDSKGYVVYNEIPFLIDPSTEGKNDIKILLQDLASIPDGFSFRDDADLYAYILAFCFGVDAREFWPATQSGATKADASVQNMKARGRGIGNRIQTIETFLRAALPDTAEFEYDYTDDDQDKMQADIRQVKTIYLSTLTHDGALNPLEERALAIAEGIVDGKLLETLDLPVDNTSGAENVDNPGMNDTNQLQDNPDDNTAPGVSTAVASLKAQAEKTEATYRKSLRSAVRGYWTGQLGAFDFYNAMFSVIQRNFTSAWADGMKQYGLDFADATDEELSRLKLEIATEVGFINGLADMIAANSKANGGQLTPIFDRLELWVNGYGRVMTLAGTLAASDLKSKWKYGDTVNHCPSCSTYEGRVYRNSTWRKWLEPYNLLPRGKGLACGGWKCDCSLEPTTEPLRRGRPPIVTKAHIHGAHQTNGTHAQDHADDPAVHESAGTVDLQNGIPRSERLTEYDPHLESQAVL